MGAIVVGTDGSPGAERALRRAVAIAKGTNDRLVLVAAYRNGSSQSEPLAGTARTEPVDLRRVAEDLLTRDAHVAQSEGVDVETQAHQGNPAHVLIDVAQEVGANLIVVGARGHSGIERFLLGSVSSKLAHHAPCDVLIVRDR